MNESVAYTVSGDLGIGPADRETFFPPLDVRTDSASSFLQVDTAGWWA
jgi:hypothetical protein